MILALISLSLSVACRAVGELHAHGKLKWMDDNEYGFWGEDSYLRKYADSLDEPPENWYYKLFNIAYKEKWPTSATFTVLFTDGPHLMQSISFVTLSLGVSLLSNVNFFIIWGGVLIIHATVYRLLQK